jgi:hypothetical protein
MRIDKNSSDIISNLLNKVLDSNRGVKVYEEIAISGNKHYLMQNAESRKHLKEIQESESPLEKMFRLNPEYQNKDFSLVHEQINNQLAENKKTIVSRRQLADVLEDNNVLKKFANIFKDFMSNEENDLINLNEDQIKKISAQALKSRNKELIKSYLLINNEEYQNPSIHLLVNGIKNIENPKGHPLMPKHVIQEVGVLQIGLALNDMATKPIDRNISDARREHCLAIKRLTQSGSTNKSEFLTFCKQVARSWEEKYEEKLSIILQEHRELEKKRKEEESLTADLKDANLNVSNDLKPSLKQESKTKRKFN